jgi:putative transposase
MYDWRKMTPEERVTLLEWRQKHHRAWHRPTSHTKGHWIHLSATCYLHASLIGFSRQRMDQFTESLLDEVSRSSLEVSAWCVLPNHYHVLLRVADPELLTCAIGKFHGRTSHAWNIEEEQQGRTCFHGCLPKPVTSVEHRWATLNYIHHNPVKHGYVTKWQDWPFSSAHEYLKSIGRDGAQKLWHEFPVLDMGKGWDDDPGT